MMDLAYGTCGLPVNPLGSKRMWLNLSTKNFSGTPYCRLKLIAVAKLSIRPEIVEPCLAMAMKISPGLVHAGCDVALMPADGELTRGRAALVGKLAAHPI